MRVLVVEDNRGIRDFLKKNLEAEYFAVDAAEDGERGAYLGRVNDYDIVILDYMLPKKTGLEVCREIRQSKKPARIIMLSVNSETATKVNLLQTGADDYMTKPFSFAELVARMRALLRRPAQIQDDVLTTGDMILDRHRHEVTCGNHLVRLTRKEFCLLELLMLTPGHVVSRGVIMEHVWDANADLFSNTIESHVSSLRHKLSAAGKQQFIETVPGAGYKVRT